VTTTDTQLEAVRTAIEPAVDALGLALYDVELLGGPSARTLRVTVTRPGGVDLDAITATTQAVSPIVDAIDAPRGPFLLEVSSPGIERNLRTPAHYEGAVGECVSVKFHTESGPRRERGTLVEADGDHAVVETEAGVRVPIALRDVTQARTVFEWGPQPRPGATRRQPTRARAKEKQR
jgi:ribosome maturation factor RimP